MQLKVVKVLLVATLVGLCSCHCTLPTKEDLEVVINGIMEADNASSTPTVNVMTFYPVCLAFDEIQDRYRAVSVVVNYTCSDNPSCPSGTAVEQIESECDNGVWSNVVRGATEHTRSQTTEANYSTSTREDCSFCVSPELGFSLSLVTNNVTHCVACPIYCDNGYMRCYDISADSCCNYYNNSMCVDECPSPFQPNTANECVCPPGTSGHNCAGIVDCGHLDDPENGKVSVFSTTHNSVANYTCNPMYDVMGDEMRTCLETGVWSGSKPNCTSGQSGNDGGDLSAGAIIGMVIAAIFVVLA